MDKTKCKKRGKAKLPDTLLLLLAGIKERYRSFLERETHYLDHQRQIILIFYTTLLSAGLLANITGLSGAFHPLYKISNTILLATIICLAVAYAAHKMSLVKTIGSMTLAMQLAMSIDTLYCAFIPNFKDAVMVILINMLILSANTIFSLATYLTRVSQIATGMALVTYIVCLVATGAEVLHDYFLILLIIMLFISAIGFRIARNAEYLVNANKTLQRDEAELLQVLRLNKKQVKAYIALAHEKHDITKTTHLLELMGTKSQKNVIDNVTEFLKRQELERQDIEISFPELTASERAICRLILQDKKQGDICAILNKSESNVSTQRANIRKKLGLQPSDSLREALAKRIGTQLT